MEDYVFVNAGATQEVSLMNLLEERTRAGKLLYGFFYYIISYIESANVIRLFGVVSLGLLAYVIYTFLKKYQIKSKHAFLLSILVCTLPSIQILVAWLVCIPYIYSAILSFAAGLLLFNVMSEKNKRSLIYYSCLFFIVVALQVTAMNIYQPTAMLYWTAGIVPLLVLSSGNFEKKWYMPFIAFFLAGFVALAAYFFFVKILHFVFNTGFVGRGGLVELTKVPVKLKWFFYCPLNYALNLWNIFPTYELAGVTGIIIIGVFLSNISQVLKNENRINLLYNHLLRLFLVTVILLLSYLPNLVITDTVPPYRTLLALAVALCFLFYFGLVNISGIFKFVPGVSSELKDKAVTIFLVILALTGTYHAHVNVKNFATLQSSDYTYVKNALSEYGVSELSGISEIYVRRYDRNKIIESGFPYDEFGLPTTAHPWGPPNVIRRALMELGVKADIRITQGRFDQPIPRGENILAIDMTKFDYVNSHKSSISKPQKYCLTIPTRL